VRFGEYAKAYVALAGLLASAGLGVTGIPVTWKLPLALVVAGAAAFATWRVPNADPPAPPAPAWASAGPAWDEPVDYWPVEPHQDDYLSAA
jgi:hypothetical protein